MCLSHFLRDLEEGRGVHEESDGQNAIHEIYQLRQDAPPQVRVADPFWSENTPPNYQQQFSDVCIPLPDFLFLYIFSMLRYRVVAAAA